MPSLTRAARRIALSLPLLFVTAPLLAQSGSAPISSVVAGTGAEVPWLYRGSDIPQDPEWVFGELPNGVRYAVRKNGVPPGQVSIRVRIDAGSLYENDSERGYAHLLEHAVFRQSRYLGDGQAIAAFQRLGATFGSDTNAETTPTGTTFKLDLPSATPATLDEAMKLVSGMIEAPTLSASGLKADVPIVLSEKRERGGTAERIQTAQYGTFFAGQPLADRSPIGTIEALQAATPESVRAFYSRWYRPENALVVVVGDADPAALAATVRKYFSEWKGTGPAAKAPSFGVPKAPTGAAADNPVGEAKVLVEAEVPRSLTYAVVRPWNQVTDNIAYNQGLMLDQIAQAIINRRLEARARAGGSYLTASVSGDKLSRSVDMTSVSITPLGADWKKALADVRSVIADARASAPTQAEIDREFAEINVAYESSVEQRRLLPGSKLADDMVQAVDIRETVANPETVLGIYQKSKPLMTPAAVLAHTRTLFTGPVVRGFYLTPQTGEATDAELRQALLAPVRADKSARVSAKPVSFASLPAIGKPAAPAQMVPTGLLGIEQVNYANGVRVMLWPQVDEPGRVTVKVRFGAGWQQFRPEDGVYARLGDMALVGSGVGPLGQEQLDAISTGRKMGFNFAIEDGAFTFSADTRPADLTDQLYLFAAKFATPRWDASPVTRAKAALNLAYDGYRTSPRGVLDRDLAYYQHGKDARYLVPTPAQVAVATPAGFKAAWAPILASGPIEVQVFGDFKREDALAALNRSFGALPARAPLPQGAPPYAAGDPAASQAPVVLTHNGDPGQAAALISWPTGGGVGGAGEGVRTSRALEVLSQVFSNRLLDSLREKLGAAYAPQVFSSWPTELQRGGAITALAQIDTKSVPVFYTTAQEIAADLAARPPTADELARVTGPLAQLLNRAATSSAFFMGQVEGGTRDPVRYAAVRSLLRDYTQVTPAEIQALAAQYLKPGGNWRLQVVPAASVPTSGPASR
jgi:zinc protease